MTCTRAPSRTWVPLVIAALGMLSGGAEAVAQTTMTIATKVSVADAKVHVIRRVLKLTKATDRIVTAIEAAIPIQRTANPQIPHEFWDDLLARARGDTARLVDMLVRIYDAQFTVAELEQLAAFYESALGRHLVEAQPIIAAQSVLAGQQWGMELAEQVGQELRRRGVQTPRR